jgi:protoporphyrin/coproporphyrin ferrochelatase
MSSTVGVLLINLGTPAGADRKSVRAYLSEFLSDPYVIDLPTPWRQLLVKGLILPFRPKTSAHAYQQIWTPEGSPLLVHSRRLAAVLTQALGENYTVALGMRYGEPSIAQGLRQLQHCRRLLILPLFPQYSSAATESALAKTSVELQNNFHFPDGVTVLHSFFDQPSFIDAWKTVILENSPSPPPQVWVFSYHGLPLRHLQKMGCDATACLNNGDCLASPAAEACYRRQCLKTSELLAKALQLTPDQYRVAFQSRLGRTPWLPPYTDQLLTELSTQGVERLGVVCPSFVVDCLETLEEIGIRARTQWHRLGGAQLTLIPCLNTHPTWVRGLAALLTKQLPLQRQDRCKTGVGAEPLIPNETTIKAMQAARKGELTKVDHLDNLLDSLNADD